MTSRETPTKTFRTSDEAMLDAANMRLVKEYAAQERYDDLLELAENKEFTWAAREAAGLMVVDGYAEKGWFSAIIRKVAVRGKLPWKVRDAAGLKAVEGYAEKGWYNTLIEMSCNDNLTANAKKAAENYLKVRIGKLAVDVGLEELKKRHMEYVARLQPPIKKEGPIKKRIKA
jgi:hypothetical protein